MPHSLDNYLRTYRRRSGLSQDEVAFLLGTRCGSKVSRYEHYARQPALETVIAYEVIFQAPVGELFAGIYEKVERRVLGRARLLAKKLGTEEANRLTLHKLDALKAVSGPAVSEPPEGE